MYFTIFCCSHRKGSESKVVGKVVHVEKVVPVEKIVHVDKVG